MTVAMSADPLLLTPGPLTTTETVKRAMLRDWGSRDPDFERLTASVLQELLLIANAGTDYAVVPLQGSGTYAVEAMITTLVPREGRILVLSNGAYGQRIITICERSGLKVIGYPVPETEVHDLAEVRRKLADDPSIHSVAVVHCETTSGLENPLDAIADVVIGAGRKLFVDSMSGFGALPVDAARLRFTALAASSNKCIQGVPGMAFVIARRDDLAQSRGRCPSLVLDLEAQHRQIEADGQWRYTPPTHVIAAFHQALQELREEGGPPARLRRYTGNRDLLIEGMARLGFSPMLDKAVQAPIIVSFAEPSEPWFSFQRFYDELKRRGFAIYAGKMKVGGTFRVGTIGAIDRGDIERFLTAAEQCVSLMRHLAK